ncbi:YihY/virulence factor BrkB family protein [Candidatus Halobonum tyrrellensis]|uniref:Ribonuclease BN n=1 Tax=Candidatus Halobonum tyrrellensis G22 TaxID=1324957 RepID=V4IZR2_9EURY|nr:YihY/virulence factor BrkB family protein [Candidatus Halobonum tyrrellensis]ESP88637.1 ribonuclease BN [Candidatus Halobonum tyrrellensis G22]
MSSQSADAGRVGNAIGLVRRVVSETSDQDVTFLAAAVAYYAFVSLFPAAVLALVVATAVGGEQLATVVLAASDDVLTETGQALLINTLQSGGWEGATVISLLLTLWGTLKVFRGIDTAFVKIYGAVESASIVDQIKDSLVVAVSIGASFLAMVVMGSVLAALNLDVVLELLGVLVLPAVLSAAFLPMYYFFPEPRVSVREVLPGAMFAGVGWTLLQAGFQAYVNYQSASGGGQVELYGVVGAVLLLVTWLYFGAIVVLVGVVVNVTLADDKGVGFDAGAPGLGGRPATDGRGGAARDRHGKGLAAYARQHMSEDEREDGPAPDLSELDRQVAELRADLDDIDDRTVEKPALEDELKRYVRSRMRRGHARGWGPYLVLLYGVVLTLGAFAWLDGWFAIGAMLILFLSTLGLYVLFVLAGIGLNLIDVPGKAIDAVRKRRGQ